MAAPARVLVVNPREISITLNMNTAGKSDSIKVTPYTFRVSKSKNEEVTWACLDPRAQFSVDFEYAEGSPFYEKHFDNQDPISGPVRRDLAPGSTLYRYSVTIDGTKQNSPGGQVDP